MTIKQGDSYSIPIKINLNGSEISSSDVDVAEFYIGEFRKLYPDEVTYSGGYFYIPLSQTETFSFTANSTVEVDVRVKLTGGTVEGIQKKIGVFVADATSEVEL